MVSASSPDSFTILFVSSPSVWLSSISSSSASSVVLPSSSSSPPSSASLSPVPPSESSEVSTISAFSSAPSSLRRMLGPLVTHHSAIDVGQYCMSGWSAKAGYSGARQVYSSECPSEDIHSPVHVPSQCCSSCCVATKTHVYRFPYQSLLQLNVEMQRIHGKADASERIASL